MGAHEFSATSENPLVDVAFRAAVNQARFEHGHGGYTGTIAEKDGYVEFTRPAGVTVHEVLDVIRDDFNCCTRPAWLPASIVEAYNDKYAPAVAIALDDNAGWIFVGIAAS